MRKSNFLVAEDHALVRKGIVRLLEHKKLANVIFEAQNGREALERCIMDTVDIAFMDLSMPEMDGFEAARKILAKKKHIKIIMLIRYDEIPIILNLFKIGVKGFLTKKADEDEIIGAVRTVNNGDYYYQSKFDKEIKEWLKQGFSRSIPSIHFSEREIQIITLISKGLTSNQIAKNLGIQPRTVETYRYDLIKKTNVHNTSELISYVYRNGLI